MRSFILWWSAGNGAIVGFMAGLALVALGALLLPFLLPVSIERSLERHGWLISTVVIAAPLIAGALLGYLEGRLKLR